MIESGFTRKQQLKCGLDEVRQKTLALFERVPDDLLRVRVHSFYSPIGWHFGHVGRTEEFWVNEATGNSPVDPFLTFLYADLPENPKDNRVNIPDRLGTMEYLAATRKASIRALEAADLSSDHELIRDGYAWSFAIQHEYQHQETIAEMLQLIQKQRVQSEVAIIPWKRSAELEWIDHPSGEFLMGSDDLHGYDNEKCEHDVKVGPFRLAKFPVTSYDWSEFVADGGYCRQEFWTPEGWEWRSQNRIDLPEYWSRQSDGYVYFGAFGLRAIHPDEPVSCISHHEALAYANYRNCRLPTEQEWEYAASSVGGHERRRFGWGNTSPNQTLTAFGLSSNGPVPVNSIKGETPLGVSGISGNVWEWTSSKFLPYPGFRAFPYDGYSLDHMKGAHYVCRGGSWATSALILRNTFRNWYVPSYRQGFLGLRLASD